jgi:hypothetical protein
LRERHQQLAASWLLPIRLEQSRDEHFAFACRDDIGKRGQRFGIHERDGASDDDKRIASGPICRPHRNTRKAQHRQDVGVVPLERDRERDDVEVANQRLRLERHHGRFRSELFFELLFRRQEKPFAHDVVVRVEKLINRLEAEIRHPNVVGVGKCQRHPQAIGVRLAGIADFFCKNGSGGLFLLPGVHGC